MNRPTRPQRDQELLDLLEELSSVKPDYPPELLAMRRDAFMQMLDRLDALRAKDSRSLDEQAMTEILESLQHQNAKYPPLLLANQRAAFLDQVAKHRQLSGAETFRSAVLNWFTNGVKALRQAMTYDMRRSLIVVSLLLAAFAGSMILREDDHPGELSGAHLAQREVPLPTQVVTIPTGSSKPTKAICAPDSPSAPSCATHGFAQSRDRTAWVSRTANSWIKIDMGRAVTINTVEMDRKSSEDASGDFTIAVAQSDGQYEKVYDSRVDQPALAAAAPETIQASFEPVLARYVKVTVVDAGIVVQEVRAFSAVPLPTPGRTDPEEDSQAPQSPALKSTSTPLPTSTPIPSNTPAPTDTLWPTNTPAPTDTPWPTDTPAPTDTLWPTNTPAPTDTPRSTNTPAPTDTLWPTDAPAPTETPWLTDPPLPGDTPAPIVTISQTEYVQPKKNQ